MTSYFDEKTHQINDCENVEQVQNIELKVIEDLKVLMENPEFPEKYKQTFQEIIDNFAITDESSKGYTYFTAMNISLFLEKLHPLFHELARDRIKLSCGELNDNPKDIVNMMQR